MGKPSRPTRSPTSNRQTTEPRANVIQAVTSPLGFFVLVVLIVEALLGILAGLSGDADRAEFVRIMAAIIVMLIVVVSVLSWFRPDALMGMRAPPTYDRVSQEGTSAIVKTFERSNDFLATGDKHQFPSLLKQAKQEVWFVGTTFFISLDQYHDLLLNRLVDGINLNFLILDPASEAVGRVAGLMAVTPKEVFHDCMSGMRILSRTIEEAKKRNASGELRLKIVADPIQTRLYMFDPRAPDGYFYYVPQLNGTNPQTLPGFLAANSKALYCEAYFKGVLKSWNDPSAKTLQEWQSLHPDGIS